ncbi:MAG: hypothetical protein RMI01_09780 [Thermodesulfovibrio sp.]|nr:hypothetical protein [Thermodesulfovibrio sp.]
METKIKRGGVKSIIINGKELFFIDVGNDFFNRPNFRLWINEKFVKYDEKEDEYYTDFPVVGGQIIEKEKNMFYLEPGKNTIFYIFVQQERYKIFGETIKKIDYYYWRGILQGQGSLLEIDKDIIVKWRRYGLGMPKKGKCILRVDGNVEYIDVDDEEIENL